MTDMGAHVWTIICSIIIFIVGLLIWFFGYANLHDTLASDNLQDATRVAMFMSSDNSARAERGSFVINKGKFTDIMNHAKIRQLGDKSLDSSDAFKVYYMPDDSYYDNDVNKGTNEDGGKGFSGNDYDTSTGDDTNPSTGKHTDISNTSRDNKLRGSSGMSTWNVDNGSDTKGYEAIRGLRVVMNPGHNKQISSAYKFKNGAKQKGTDKATQNKIDKYTATEIVQTNAKDSNNDTYNDLTR